jgi:hypothetical protein
VRFSGCEVAQHKCSILPDDASLWNCRHRDNPSVSGHFEEKFAL